MLEITCLEPRDVRPTEEVLFRHMVQATGEVNPRTFPALYQRARSVCFARIEGEIAGVGALKRPNPGHRTEVFDRAEATLLPDRFSYELGWFHVDEAFKGRRISSQMVGALLEQSDGESVYATSRINNHPMHAALTGHGGFVRVGIDYPSSRGDVPLCLFVRLASAS